MRECLNICAVILAVFINGCGNSTGSFTSNIDEISTRDKTIIPNSRTQVRIRFTAAADFQGYDFDGDAEYVSEPFGVSVFLPPGVVFVEKSSRLTDSLFGDVLFGNPDQKEPFEQGRCNDGRFYMRYFFERNEIRDPEPEALFSLYLKFEADVAAEASGREVGAAISYESDPCAEVADEFVVLAVEN